LSHYEDIGLEASFDQTDRISRRSPLISAGAAGLAIASGAGIAGDMPGHRDEDHAPTSPDVLRAVNARVVAAQQCSAHCLVAFQDGDTMLADFAKKVNDMLPICKAFSYQLAANSPYFRALPAVRMEACEDREKECRVDEDKHIECKDCAEACAQVISAIKTLSA